MTRIYAVLYREHMHVLDTVNVKREVTEAAFDTTRDLSRIVAVVDGFADVAIAKVKALVAADESHPHYTSAGIDILAVTMTQEAE